MLKDLDDKLWKDQKLNNRMHKCLDTNVDVCRSLITDTLKVLQEIDSGLDCFNEVTTRRMKVSQRVHLGCATPATSTVALTQTQGESIKTTIRRVRHSVTITFQKSRYEERLSSLRKYNEDLGTLREQLGAFKRPPSCSTNPCIAQNLSLPPRFGITQRASQKLHEALTTSWCCADAKHTDHCARLCLDAEVNTDSVRFDLAISYHRSHTNVCSISAPEDAPTWIYVRSTTLDTTESISNHEPRSVRLDVNPTNDRLVLVNDRRKVCLADDSPQSLNTNVRIADTGPIEKSALDPCRSRNMCDLLARSVCPPDSAREEWCIGYLESPKFYKHIVYASDSKSPTRNQAKLLSSTDIITLDNLLHRSIQDDLTLIDQLQLAHRIAAAVLQHHSTSWLSDRWHLRDLALFSNHDEVPHDALRTLHVRSVFPESSSQAGAISTDDVRLSKPEVDTVISAQDAQLLYGISNTTLFYLGVALLELGQWRTLQSLQRPDDAHDIVTARRLAAGRAPLGTKFQNIVRKCLQCDFGVGNDLRKAELQSAVYSDVVCKLEEMISIITI